MKKTLLTISAGLLIGLGAFAQAPVKSVVADGEQGNKSNVGTFWFAYPNTTQGKTSTILINGKAVDGVTDLESSTGGSTGSCISASGVLALTAGPDYESAGTGFALAPIEATLDADNMVTNSSAVAVDLSTAQGIEFMYKSTAGKLIIGVFTTDIKQNSGHDYFVELPAAADWTKFTLAFPGSTYETVDGFPVLTQPSWLSATTPWDGSKVFKLQFQVKDVDGAYSFAIDDITIVGKAIANKVALSAAWYALDDKIKTAGAAALQTDIDNLAAGLVVLNNPNATQAECDAAATLMPVAELTADLAVKAGEIVISASKTISSVALINAAGAVVSKVSVGSSVATVSTAAAQGATVAVIVYADGSAESTTFVK